MKNIAKKSLAFCFIGLITALTVANLTVALCCLQEAPSPCPFSVLVQATHTKYVQQFKWKNTFIELNGAYARLLGQRVCNKIARLNNGMLARLETWNLDKELPEAAAKIAHTKAEVEKLGSRLIYINLPDKPDRHSELSPTGTQRTTNQDSDLLLEMLAQRHIDTLDVRSAINERPEDLARYFYATDHHWNALGALKAAPLIVKKIDGILGTPERDLGLLEETRWTLHTRNAWWLGSEGKRVGRYYGGLDTLLWYEPRFETSFSVAIPAKNNLRKGAYADTFLERKWIDQRHDFYQTSAYRVYLGSDYPLVKCWNPQATSSKRLLIIKDSFANAIAGFLALCYREVDLIDLRAFKDCSALEYIRRTRPDLVMIMLNPSVRRRILLKLSESETPLAETATTPVAAMETLTLPPEKKKSYHFRALNAPLENGATYVLNVKAVEVNAGETAGISLGIYDPCTKKCFTRALYDLDYIRAKGGLTYEFSTPKSGHWQLIFYSGIAGKTQHIGVTYRGITLEKRQQQP